MGKTSRDYTEAVSVCELDRTTMSVLEIGDGDLVSLETIDGEVVVRARLGRGLEPGMGFIPAGPYANVIISADTWESGMPDFKGVRAKVFKAAGSRVFSIKELVAKMLEE